MAMSWVLVAYSWVQFKCYFQIILLRFRHTVSTLPTKQLGYQPYGSTEHSLWILKKVSLSYEAKLEELRLIQNSQLWIRLYKLLIATLLLNASSLDFSLTFGLTEPKMKHYRNCWSCMQNYKISHRCLSSSRDISEETQPFTVKMLDFWWWQHLS